MAEGDRMTSRVCTAQPGFNSPQREKRKRKSNSAIVGADSVGFNHHSIRTITISCHHAFDYIISNPSATSSDFFFSLYPAGAVASARRGSFLFKNGIQQKRKGTQVGGGIFNSWWSSPIRWSRNRHQRGLHAQLWRSKRILWYCSTSQWSRK